MVKFDQTSFVNEMTDGTKLKERRCLLFDLDGTLIDSIGDLNSAANRMLASHGRAPVGLAEMRPMIGDGVGKLVERVLAARPGSPPIDDAEALQQYLDFYEADPATATTAYPAVPETLSALAAAGYRLAVCTNKPEKVTRLVLDRLSLASFFDLVVGGDTMPFRKPDPRLITFIAEKLGVGLDDTLLIGDSEVDAATAEAAFIPFILMSYGYRRGPAETIPAAAALDRFGDLVGLLTS